MIRAYPIPGKKKSADLCAAFVEGAPRSAQGSVFYGVNSSNMTEFGIARARGGWYYIDNSYFNASRVGMQLDKPGYFRITKNAFQIHASDHHRSDGRRLDALGIKIAPWKGDRLGYCLAVEQSQSFMQDIGGDGEWLRERIRRVINRGGVVKLRPWSADKPALATTLDADIGGAAIVLTHSSAAAVEAVIAGVEIHVSPMSALFGVPPERRVDALEVLADNQFTIDEMKNGKAWQWLNRN